MKSLYLSFFEIYRKINRNQLEIVVETTYGLKAFNTLKY